MSITCNDARRAYGTMMVCEECAICGDLVHGRTIEIMHSGAGHYLGTRDNDGGPNCRITGYYKERICKDMMQRIETRLQALRN